MSGIILVLFSKYETKSSRLKTRESMMQIFELVSKVEIGISQGTGGSSPIPKNSIPRATFVCNDFVWTFEEI